MKNTLKNRALEDTHSREVMGRLPMPGSESSGVFFCLKPQVKNLKNKAEVPERSGALPVFFGRESKRKET